MIRSSIIPARPDNLAPVTLDVPFSAPTGLRTRTYPASPIIHYSSTVEGDRGRSRGRIDELAPGRVPCLAVYLRWLLTENNPHQVEMVDGHVYKQRLPYLVVAMRSEEHTSELQSLAYLV